MNRQRETESQSRTETANTDNDAISAEPRASSGENNQVITIDEGCHAEVATKSTADNAKTDQDDNTDAAENVDKKRKRIAVDGLAQATQETNDPNSDSDAKKQPAKKTKVAKKQPAKKNKDDSTQENDDSSEGNSSDSETGSKNAKNQKTKKTTDESSSSESSSSSSN